MNIKPQHAPQPCGWREPRVSALTLRVLLLHLWSVFLHGDPAGPAPPLPYGGYFLRQSGDNNNGGAAEKRDQCAMSSYTPCSRKAVLQPFRPQGNFPPPCLWFVACCSTAPSPLHFPSLPPPLASI